MNLDKIKGYPLWAWTAAALSAPAAQLAAHGSWPAVLAVAVACGGLCALARQQEQAAEFGRWYAVLQFLFLAWFAGIGARYVSQCWHTAGDTWEIRAVVILLAAACAWNGAPQASRVGGTVFWLLVLLYGAVLGAGVRNVRLEWIGPAWSVPHALLIPTLLLPAAAAMLPHERTGKEKLTLALTELFAVLVAVLVAGTLSPAVAGSIESPFYEFSKSLSFFGIAERFEAAVSVALTIGYFSLLSLLFTLAGQYGEKVFPGRRKGTIVGCAGLCTLFSLVDGEKWSGYTAIFAVALWGILPLLGIFWGKTKKRQKRP